MNRLAVANELVKVAEELVAMEFPSEESLRKYLQEHPLANQSNHTVKKSEGDKLREQVYDIHHASELVKIAEDISDFPFAMIFFGHNRISFEIRTIIPDTNGTTNLKSGSEPYLKDPAKAIRRVLDIIEQSGCKPQNIEIGW